MTIFLYFLNVACSAGQSTLSKQYASSGGNANVYNINKMASNIAGMSATLNTDVASFMGTHLTATETAIAAFNAVK